VDADFEHECDQARKLAARYFDGRRVLVDLLNALGL
jgi:hypothetical protein